MLRSAYHVVVILLSLPLNVAFAGVITVTIQVAVRLVPSLVLAVMVAVPSPFAVTKPEELTVATEVLLLLQVTPLYAAMLGVIVAISVAVSPIEENKSDVLSSEIPVALRLTVTLQVAERFVPSVVLAVIVAVPSVTAVTLPFELTVATDVLLLVHVTVLTAVSGTTEAVSVAVGAVDVNVSSVLFNEMPVASSENSSIFLKSLQQSAA